ncbi:MAG: DUF1934 domain-containing protein [Clostridia bacterium]|nr:DUF1934 domain-containing protein [Clostridia bacterium]
MNNSYIVTIKDNHEQDGESFSAEFTCACEYVRDGENCTVSYAEKGGELDGSVVSIKVINAGTVEVTRIGEYNTRLTIEKDRRHTCIYNTPLGELSIGVYSDEVTTQIRENGAEIRLRYTLDFNSGLISTNTMLITVKEADGNVTAC